MCINIVKFHSISHLFRICYVIQTFKKLFSLLMVFKFSYFFLNSNISAFMDLSISLDLKEKKIISNNSNCREQWTIIFIFMRIINARMKNKNKANYEVNQISCLGYVAKRLHYIIPWRIFFFKETIDDTSYLHQILMHKTIDR